MAFLLSSESAFLTGFLTAALVALAFVLLAAFFSVLFAGFSSALCDVAAFLLATVFLAAGFLAIAFSVDFEVVLEAVAFVFFVVVSAFALGGFSGDFLGLATTRIIFFL